MGRRPHLASAAPATSGYVAGRYPGEVLELATMHSSSKWMGPNAFRIGNLESVEADPSERFPPRLGLPVKRPTQHQRVHRFALVVQRCPRGTRKWDIGMIIANAAIEGMNKVRSKVRDWLVRRRPHIVTVQKIGLNHEFSEETFREIAYKSRILGNR